MTNRMGIVTSPGIVEFVDKELRQPEEGEVLIRIRASGICGGDLHIFADKHPMVRLPVAPGHEFCGDIAELGPGVRGFAVGDRVSVEPVIVCGTCPACRKGQYGYCENISFAYRRGDGAMAPWFVAKQEYLYKLPDSISYDAGTLLEPMAVAVHALRRADVQMGQTVLITGAGTIGILIAALCRLRGAKEIIITDLSDFRLQKALSMGATQAVNTAREPLEDALAALGYAKGLDQSFECVGHPLTVNQCVNALKSNGCLTVLGLSHETKMELPITRIITKELRVQGSQGYCHDFEVALALMERYIDVEPLVTHRFCLTQLQHALETASDRAADTLKVVVHP